MTRIARQLFGVFTLNAALACAGPGATAAVFEIKLPSSAPEPVYDGRLILIIAVEDDREPRYQVSADFDAAQIFGVNVEQWQRGEVVRIDGQVLGFPARKLSDVPAGHYFVQAVLHKYDTFELGNGKTVKLPATRGAGQNWRKEPGNLLSKPRGLSFDPTSTALTRLELSEVNPPIAEPEDSEYIRRIKIRSERLSAFWGTDCARMCWCHMILINTPRRGSRWRFFMDTFRRTSAAFVLHRQTPTRPVSTANASISTVITALSRKKPMTFIGIGFPTTPRAC